MNGRCSLLRATSRTGGINLGKYGSERRLPTDTVEKVGVAVGMKP